MIRRLFTLHRAGSEAQRTSDHQHDNMLPTGRAIVALIAVLGLLVAACGAPAATPTSVPLEPFSARRESGEGFVVEWSGNTRGHEPGQTSIFETNITNETEQDWQGRFCLELLDKSGPQTSVSTLETRPFELQPGVGFSTRIEAQMPQALDPGAYGLSLVVRRPGGPMIDVVPIQVGDTSEEYGATTQTDMDAAAEACPPLEGEAIELPQPGAAVVLPIHILAHVGEPGQQVSAWLVWEDGTELVQSYTALEDPDGGGLLVDSLDWTMESQPPQPPTQPATLTLRNEAGDPLAEVQVTVLSPDDPDTARIDLYWALGELLESEQRQVLDTGDLPTTALEELLWGPPPRNLAGFSTAIPTPEEVLDYPGREAGWGVRVQLRSLTIENGVATADFSQEMRAYGGGSARVQMIRDQISQTLMQFQEPAIDQVQIAVEGQTEGVLQP
jgi:hypothetical protein